MWIVSLIVALDVMILATRRQRVADAAFAVAVLLCCGGIAWYGLSGLLVQR